MRLKICSSSSLISSTASTWHLGGCGCGCGCELQLQGFVGSYGAQQFLIAPAIPAPPCHHVLPLHHKSAAADESVLWTLQQHLQLMPSRYILHPSTLYMHPCIMPHKNLHTFFDLNLQFEDYANIMTFHKRHHVWCK